MAVPASRHWAHSTGLLVALEALAAQLERDSSSQVHFSAPFPIAIVDVWYGILEHMSRSSSAHSFWRACPCLRSNCMQKSFLISRALRG